MKALLTLETEIESMIVAVTEAVMESLKFIIVIKSIKRFSGNDKRAEDSIEKAKMRDMGDKTNNLLLTSSSDFLSSK